MRRKIGIVARHVLLTFLAVIWLVPIAWLLCTSLSAYNGINTSTFFPETWSVTQYVKILTTSNTVADFPAWFRNTFIIACCTCLISSSFVLMVAYAFSCLRFRSRKALMNLSVTINLFPGVLSMIAVYFVLKNFNLTNNHFGLILVYSASSGLGYLIAKGFFDTVPASLREAAKIDGASELRCFLQVVVPMSKPIIVYTVINSFLTPWMDFIFAEMILNAGISSQWTVAIGLYHMLEKSLVNTYFGMFCAGGVLISIPISVLFMLMQKFYVEGMSGAVKG